MSQACWTTTKLCLYPTRESLDFLVKLRKTYVWPDVCYYAALRGSVRVLKWTRENNRAWGARTSHAAAQNGHLPALQYLRENGCRWDEYTCGYATQRKHWDCLQYAVDNKAPDWEYYAKKHAKHLQ